MRTARFVLLFSIPVFIAASATGAEVAKGFKRHALGGGAEIQLPKKWQLGSFPMPAAMGMPPGTGEYRLQVDDMRMGITAIVYPDGGSLESTMPETIALLKKAMAPYVAGSKDGAIVPIEFTNGKLFGVHASRASKDGQAVFRIFQGPPYACVTTAIVRAPKATYSVSIGSGSCESDTHKTALTAIASMQISD